MTIHFDHESNQSQQPSGSSGPKAKGKEMGRNVRSVSEEDASQAAKKTDRVTSKSLSDSSEVTSRTSFGKKTTNLTDKPGIFTRIGRSFSAWVSGKPTLSPELSALMRVMEKDPEHVKEQDTFLKDLADHLTNDNNLLVSDFCRRCKKLSQEKAAAWEKVIQNSNIDAESKTKLLSFVKQIPYRSFDDAMLLYQFVWSGDDRASRASYSQELLFRLQSRNPEQFVKLLKKTLLERTEQNFSYQKVEKNFLAILKEYPETSLADVISKIMHNGKLIRDKLIDQ
jgi:hypothetical protein